MRIQESLRDVILFLILKLNNMTACYNLLEEEVAMEGMLKQIGASLKAARVNRGLTQSQVAEYLGIDQTMLSKIESGTRTIGAATLDKLAALYFCTIDQLLGESPLPTQAVSFRSKDLQEEDVANLAEIGRIVGNLEEMTTLLKRIVREGYSHE